MNHPTYLGLREALIGHFGESAEQLALAEEEWEEYAGGTRSSITPYRYMSTVFFEGLLVPAIEQDDRPMIRDCCEFIEQILSGSDDDLRECLTIRVSIMTLTKDHWQRAANEYAGPLWQAELARLRKDRTSPRL